MEQLEMEIHSSPSADRAQLEREVLHRLDKPVLASLTRFFEESPNPHRSSAYALNEPEAACITGIQ